MVARWSKEEIAVEILRSHAAQEPLSYGEMQKRNLRLLRAATRHFGSWRAAVEYAGLDYEEIRLYKVWTRDRILNKLREYHAAGEDLSWRHVSTELDPALAAAAVRSNRFGSWQRTIEAAGLDYEEIRRHRRWSADEVLEELRRLQSEGSSLRVTDASEYASALVAAARRHFDGWYEAICAAGIDELEARLGPDSELDLETARGEVSWAQLQESAA
ncbi:MAG: hypothetical protein ACK47B_04445 [Armatimonadota bacterium]